jgi:microcystin-dependent protein
MSIILSRLLAQSVTMLPATVALSPESVTVLLFASGLLEQPQHWLDLEEDPLDEITVADWDEIEKLVANVYEEIMNPMIGYCFPLITGTLPDNCLLLDGSTHAREDYPQLYAVLDGVFIVDADNFFLPDMRSRIPVGAGTGTGLSAYTVNEQGGSETETLSEAQMPSHFHTTNMTTGLAVAPGELPVNIPTPFPIGTTNSAGGGLSHNNIQPYTALPWAVVAL